jgi:hypothetical protein
MSETVEAFTELDAASDLVCQSRSQFFAQNLGRWFRALDGYPLFARIVLQQLNAEIEFDAWYKRCTETMRGMIGSGKLLWPPEPHNVIALQLALFRRFEREEITPLDFCTNFLHSNGGIDAMVHNIVDQLFRPMVIDLRRYLQGALRSAPVIPTVSVAPPSASQSGDRVRFIEVAPHYYAVAIISYFQDREHRSTTAANLVERMQDEWSNMQIIPVGLLETPPIFWKAIDWMVSEGLVRLIEDEFAPTMIVRNAGFTTRVVELTKVQNTPLQKFADLNDDQLWLTAVLFEIEKRANEFGITDEDFNNPDLEWAPIPLDRSEPELNEVIESVDNAVEIVRADNGYAANKPEERNYVVDGLSVFRTRIKEAASISMPYIRQYAIDPTIRGIKTLGQSAAGVALELFKQKVKEWLVSRGIPWLWP